MILDWGFRSGPAPRNRSWSWASPSVPSALRRCCCCSGGAALLRYPVRTWSRRRPRTSWRTLGPLSSSSAVQRTIYDPIQTTRRTATTAWPGHPPAESGPRKTRTCWAADRRSDDGHCTDGRRRGGDASDDDRHFRRCYFLRLRPRVESPAGVATGTAVVVVAAAAEEAAVGAAEWSSAGEGAAPKTDATSVASTRPNRTRRC